MADDAVPPDTPEVAEEVGYGKPPKATQWKPGQSGNPKGKAKGAKSLKTVVLKQAWGKVVIKEAGKIRTVTSVEAIFLSMRSKALGGDVKAAGLVLSLYKEYLPTETVLAAVPLSTEDLAILQNHGKFMAMIDGAEPDGSD
jgi:hypothetical protein